MKRKPINNKYDYGKGSQPSLKDLKLPLFDNINHHNKVCMKYFYVINLEKIIIYRETEKTFSL